MRLSRHSLGRGRSRRGQERRARAIGDRSALGRSLDWARGLALGLDVAIDEFDYCHGGVVAGAKSRLHDPRISAVAILVAGTQDVDPLLAQIRLAQTVD